MLTQKDCRFEARQDYIVRPNLKGRKKGERKERERKRSKKDVHNIYLNYKS
jgi:hypothetical protein